MPIDRFVSIDGGGVNVTNIAVGSHRYRVTFKGPGGHSYGAFGLANPVGALGRAVAKLSDVQVPAQPKTTFTIGRIGGGTSVNSIPFEAWMEVDMRSSNAAALAALDGRFHAAVDEAVAEENRRWSRPGMITVVKELVGDRPAGETPAASPIVQTALTVGRTLGLAPGLGEGSTDANLPISLESSRHHDRRRRNRLGRPRAYRVVRRDRCLERDAECGPARDCVDPGVADAGAVRTLRSAFP